MKFKRFDGNARNLVGSELAALGNKPFSLDACPMIKSLLEPQLPQVTALTRFSRVAVLAKHEENLDRMLAGKILETKVDTVLAYVRGQGDTGRRLCSSISRYLGDSEMCGRIS